MHSFGRAGQEALYHQLGSAGDVGHRSGAFHGSREVFPASVSQWRQGGPPPSLPCLQLLSNASPCWLRPGSQDPDSARGLPTRLLPSLPLQGRDVVGGLVCPTPPVPCAPGPSCRCGSRSGGTLFTSCPWLLHMEPTWHAGGARRCGSDRLTMGARGGRARLLPVWPHLTTLMPRGPKSS